MTPATLKFAKMHGAGNDFIVLDCRDTDWLPDADTARRWGDRRLGVGFDQLMVITALPGTTAGATAPSSGSSAAADRRGADAPLVAGYRIFNTDGSEAGQCGNGARCVAAFLAADLGLDETFRLLSPAGVIACRAGDDGQVSLEMSVPAFEPVNVPLQVDAALPLYTLPGDDGPIHFGAVSMGNPHAVIEVDDVACAPVDAVSEAIRASGRFPAGVNVGFMQVLSGSHIKLRVNERGVGETLACGTGACAAAAVGQLQQKLGPNVRVDLPGGQLMVSWQGSGHSAWLTGPAVHVYEGIIEP